MLAPSTPAGYRSTPRERRGNATEALGNHVGFRCVAPNAGFVWMRACRRISPTLLLWTATTRTTASTRSTTPRPLADAIPLRRALRNVASARPTARPDAAFRPARARGRCRWRRFPSVGSESTGRANTLRNRCPGKQAPTGACGRWRPARPTLRRSSRHGQARWHRVSLGGPADSRLGRAADLEAQLQDGVDDPRGPDRGER